MEISLIQYLMPGGKKKPIQVLCDDKVKDKVEEIYGCGCHFTCEIISTGEVVFYTTYTDLGDFIIRIGENTPSANKILEEMIMSFDKDDFQQWKKEVEEMMADFEPWEKEMENGVYYGQNREFFEEEYVDGDTNDKISW
jgi:hypothetical protein